MLSKCFLAIVTMFSLLHVTMMESLEKTNCSSGHLINNTVSLLILTTKDDHDEWVTTFTAQKDSTNSSNGLIVDVKHYVVECNQKHTVKVHGVVRVATPGSTLSPLTTAITDCKDRLLFHIRKGVNAEVTNNGRTAYRKAGDNHAGVLTNRMLKRNEMFEIIIDEVKPVGSSFGFGLTSVPAPAYPFSDWMKNGWILYENHVYVNGAGSHAYPVNLGSLQAGERIGVMRKDNGDVHFYINGVDQGVAVTGVPPTVYGAFDLYVKGVRGTINDTCN